MEQVKEGILTPEIIQFIVGQVGVAGVAYLALIMMERNHKEGLKREDQTNKQLDLLLNRVLAALEKNSEMNSALLHTINELSERILYAERRGSDKSQL